MEPRIPDDECAGGRACTEDGRWACSQNNDWEDQTGRRAWGDDDSEPALLAYLASMTLDEHQYLAETAHFCLDDGCWQGFTSPNGGYEDGRPWDERERAWRSAARDFMERRALGEWQLTEGMILGASYDLCRELAWVRGWCPAMTVRPAS